MNSAIYSMYRKLEVYSSLFSGTVQIFCKDSRNRALEFLSLGFRALEFLSLVGSLHALSMGSGGN